MIFLPPWIFTIPKKNGPMKASCLRFTGREVTSTPAAEPSVNCIRESPMETFRYPLEKDSHCIFVF